MKDLTLESVKRLKGNLKLKNVKMTRNKIDKWMVGALIASGLTILYNLVWTEIIFSYSLFLQSITSTIFLFFISIFILSFTKYKESDFLTSLLIGGIATIFTFGVQTYSADNFVAYFLPILIFRTVSSFLALYFAGRIVK